MSAVISMTSVFSSISLGSGGSAPRAAHNDSLDEWIVIIWNSAEPQQQNREKTACPISRKEHVAAADNPGPRHASKGDERIW
jgi:hypothetical protein